MVSVCSAEPPVWVPTPEQVAGANLTHFMQLLRSRGIEVPDSAALWSWSVTEPDRFWQAVLEYTGIVADLAPGPVLVDRDRMPGARWFPGAKLNFAENLLRACDDSPALVFRSETGERRELSRRELRGEVARVADGLREAGVVAGDRVAGFLPNVPEAVVAMLATTSLGAVWSSCSPDFGTQGVLDRFGQITPKVLFTADGYVYGGKAFDSLERIAAVVGTVDSIRRVVVVASVSRQPDLSRVPAAVAYADFGRPAAGLCFERLPFDHPLYILYSSGTTGTPKCIVHGAGGTLLQHLKEHQLHTDIKAGDRVFFFTTCGWMMWNWLVSALASSATVVLYEGSPLHPQEGVLWRMAEEEAVAVFGTSPKYLSALQKSGYVPREHHDLSALRTVLSTGSPLAPEQFDYVRVAVGDRVQLGSMSGGTDIISCFALAHPLLPVHRGELQSRGLGMKVEVWDEAGHSVVGRKGELVCTAPFPSMPVGFWNDPDGAKYRAAYFERFPGVWHHGDYALLNEHGGMQIFGRSDAVLNPGGVRIGTAEIYRQVEQLDEVLESVVIGQEWHDDVRVVLFVRLREGLQLDDALRQRICAQIRRNTTPRHVPAKILQVPEVPRTISGKVVELAVREVVHGRPVGNRDALANPAALDHFCNRPELLS